MGLFLYIKSRLSIPAFVSIKQTLLDLSVFTCSTTSISVTTIASRLARCTTLWSTYTFTCSWTSNDRLQGCKFDLIIISQGREEEMMKHQSIYKFLKLMDANMKLLC